MRALLLLAAFVACSYAVSLNWQVGTEYIYNVVGTLDARGNVNGTRSKGSYGSMNSTLVIQCLKNDYKHQSNSFFFVMNMFDTNVDVEQGMSVSLTSDDGLGDDMYFWQTANGSIPETWYEDGDSPYFVNVKLGVINAFQTFIVNANQQLTVDETDPVGVHQANMVGASHAVGVQITKTFDENSFSSFADTTLTAKNIKLAADTTTVVHNQGYIYSSTVNQVVTLTAITPSSSSSSRKSKRDNSAVDVLLSSGGSLSIAFQGTNTNKQHFPAPTFNSSTLTKSNMLTTSRAMMAFMNVMSVDGEDQKSISALMTKVLNPNTPSSYKLTRMIKTICTYLELNPVSMGLLLPRIKTLGESSPMTTSRLMLILSQINHTAAADMLISYGLKAPNSSVVISAVLATHRAVFVSKEVLKTLISLSTLHSDKLVRNVAQMAVKSWIKKHTSLAPETFPSHKQSIKDNSDFPYNKSWSGDASFGGTTVGVDFSASVFAGTNFDCQHTTFNYEAQAKADVTATLFGHSTNAVDAGLIYGRENGNALQDQIYVSVFGDMVYDQQLSQIDCIQHSADIAHTSPGFSVDYVIWISIIPVTFSASASLDLDLSYFWNICPDQLTAELELMPSSTLTVGGSAEIDLLIVKAGVELDGNFEAQVPPKAEVDGSLCQVTFEVDLQSKPIAVNMDAYYAVKSCKYWIFDCHWKEQGQTTIFSWAEPEHDDVLFQQTWKIAAK